MPSALFAEQSDTEVKATEDALQFRQLSIQNGLIDNEIENIIQDKNGFIWLASGQGLIKFDGLNYKNYYHSVKIPDSISNNITTSIIEDQKGNIWVGTENGLNKITIGAVAFEHYYHEPNNDNSLDNNFIKHLLIDSREHLWVATESTLHLLQADNKSFKRYSFKRNQQDQPRINFLIEYAEQLLVGTNIGLFAFDRTTQDFILQKSANSLASEVLDYTAAGIDKYQQLWIHVANHGLHFRGPDSDEYSHLQFKKPVDNQIMKTLDVSAMSIASVGHHIWLGTTTSGLYHLSMDGAVLSKVRQFQETPATAFETAGINDLYEDNSGLLWIATENAGVFQWNPNSINISLVGNVSSLPEADFFAAQIWYIFEDTDKRIWLGTRQGLMQFDKSSGNYTRFKLNIDNKEIQPAVYWIDQYQGHLWMATDLGLVEYDIETKETNIYKNGPGGNLAQTDGGDIYAVSVFGDRLFYGINNVGVFAIDLESKQPLNLAITKNSVSNDLLNSPLAFVSDSNGSIWILTRTGLVNYDPETDNIIHHFTAGANALSGERISALYQQSEHVYWVGTIGNGFNRLTLNPNDGSVTIEQFDYTDQMANLIVIGMLVDDAESPNLWLSTHGGLFVFNIESRYLRKVSESEGIQGLEFNEGAYLKDSRGSLYFGGVDGFNIINPNKFNQSSYNPPIRLSSYEIICEEQDEQCATTESAFENYVHCLSSGAACKEQNVEFPYDLVSISLSFSALDFTIPEVNLYRYRLTNGKDSPWQELGSRHQITFSRLDSGSYNLEIQGTNYVGRWSDNSLKLGFEVKKPWYLENYTLVSTVIFILISAYYYLQNRRYRARQQQRIQWAIRKNEQNFKTVLWGSGDELWEWNTASDLIERTNPIKRIDTSDEHRITFQESLSLIHPEDLTLFQADIEQLLKRKIPHSETTFRVRNKQGDYLWVLVRGRVVERDQHGHAKRVLGSLKDITSIKATEDKLTLIAQAFENTKDAISVVDSNFRSVFNNKAFYDLTGLTVGEGINHQYLFTENSNNHNMQSQVQASLERFGKWEGEIWERRASGEQFAMDLKIAVVADTPEENSTYICVFSDITYKKRSEEELIKLANIDALTNLPNRSLFLDRLSHAIAYSKRNDTPFALLFVDLDNFKNINDTLGHSIGDKMIQQVGKRLKQCVRDVDTVARLGGDEFTIILENISNTNEVGVCANKLLENLSKPMKLSDGLELKTTLSIGIGMYPEHGADQETILKNADLAMYSAKSKGKNNYQFFTEDMTSLAMERVSIESKLREAIDNNELALYYQPKVYSVNYEVTGFEALVRWIHPEDGIISPASFIPVAEETGLIIRLGAWILEEAVRQAKDWSLINPSCASIAVNISAKQFMSEDLPKQIESLLNKYELEAKYIEIEITEGTLMENMQHTISTLHQLRDMGLRIALDDFGTGYSSLSYLKEFPVTQLKIDQSFVRDITTDPSDASIVASIITLAHNLGLNVVAEGCETKEQLKFIRSYHCEQVQGYLFSKPLPVEKAELILQKGKIKI